MCFYEVLRYLGSIAIQTKKINKQAQLAHVLRPISFIDPNHTSYALRVTPRLWVRSLNNKRKKLEIYLGEINKERF